MTKVILAIAGRVANVLIPFLLIAGAPLADPPPSPPTKSLHHDKGTDIGDPISANSGAFHFRLPLLDLGGPLPLRFALDYRMDRWTALWNSGIDGPFESELSQYLEREGDVVMVYLRGGDFPCFRRDAVSGEWLLDAASPVRYAMAETGDTWTDGCYYVMDPRRGQVFIFEKRPSIHTGGGFSTVRIMARIDRNNNRLTYTYADDNALVPSRVEDGFGRSLDFTYSGIRLSRVTDQAGRFITLIPGTPGGTPGLQCGVPVLDSVTDAEGQVTRFVYDCSGGSLLSIAEVVRPRGNVPYGQTVDFINLDGQDGVRVTRQTDAYGNTTTLQYDGDINRVSETRPDGETAIYEHVHNDGVPKTLTDVAGKTSEFDQTAHEQLSVITDRLGDTTSFTYHPDSGMLASFTNAAGQITTWTYTPQVQPVVNPRNAEEVDFTFFNLTRIDFADGTFETYTHDERGNVLIRADGAGSIWTYSYNTHGQLLTAENPAGGSVSYTYNNDTTLATAKDSETGVTTYDYDAYKRVNRITHPDGTFIQLAYDLNDHITSIRDENLNETRFEYDANGNMVRIIGPDNMETTVEYDLMDRPVTMIDRLGNESAYGYDVMNRLAETVDATGVRTSFGHDPRGWMNTVTRAGRTWTTIHDDEGVFVSHTTPLGRTFRQTTDRLGQIKTAIDPAGGVTTRSRDAMNRLTSSTDPNDRSTGYTYDALGRLTGVTLPSGEAGLYEYDGLGRLATMVDLNGAAWHFAHSPMGRLQSITDPLARITQQAFDVRGRVSAATFPDATTLTITRDPAGNVLQRRYSGGLDLSFTYDALNRPLTADHITLTRDGEGRITGTADQGVVSGASYDAAGRLVTAGYCNDSFTVTYTYEVGTEGTGRLIRVDDDLTSTRIDFAYDHDGRLVAASLPNGQTITWTWDDADRLIRLRSGEAVDLVLTLDPGGYIRRADLTSPLPPGDYLEAGTETLSFDAASQTSTAGHAHDARGRVTATPRHAFTWDGASRLIGIDDDTLSYNGLGQLRTRTARSATTHYYYNHAIAGAPVVAERNAESGQMQRYYVWTPEGRLLYLIDALDGNQVYFYHFDQAGTTLALTDMNGEVTDAYAYDPYGRILARTGNNSQPFTFVGAWGVRQEGSAGDLYQMRARWYDAVDGRFLAPEPLWPRISDPMLLNPYQYAKGNPLMWIDATGKEPSRPGPMTPVHMESGSDDFWTNAMLSSIETALVKKSYEESSRFKVMGAGRRATGRKFAPPLFIHVMDEGDKVVVLIFERESSVPVMLDMFEIGRQDLETGEPRAPDSLWETLFGSGVKRIEGANKVADAFVERVATGIEQIINARNRQADF